KFLDLTLKNAAELTEDDKIFILLNFFMSNWDNMIRGNNRYLQLLEMRGRHTSKAEIKNALAFFKEEDFRDLQVWFNLAWFDPLWVRTDELIKRLHDKGRNFSEEDKQALIAKQFEICGKIVQKHKEAQDRGQIEVSVSPFYHPILPLLCDTNSALQAAPQMPLPQKRYSHPQDAQKQISDAVDYYEQIFGQKPKGMWPSEGSVSDEAVDLIAQNGFSWAATDEAILFNSNKQAGADRRQLFMPHFLQTKAENGVQKKINLIFRDHNLSDAIGFVYSKWKAEDAANDFISKLYDIRAYMGDYYEAPLVSVILDGENCWEYYENDGWDFLTALYTKLSNNPDIETVRVSDYLERFPAKAQIEKLTAGSWINGNFYVWIGNKDTNTSWDKLSAARDFFHSYLESKPELKDSPQAKEALANLMVAQGSDWNWWYCPDHLSESAPIFDCVYRLRLMRVYQSLGQPAPNDLFSAIKEPSADTVNAIKAPVAHIKPTIDGVISDKWINAAGAYQVGHEGGSMHQVSTVLRAFYFGIDESNLFLAFRMNADISPKVIKDLSFCVKFTQPAKSSVKVELNSDGSILSFSVKGEDGVSKDLDKSRVAYKENLEMAIPFGIFDHSARPFDIEFRISVYKNGFAIERWPYSETVRLSSE
ncbi:MAG: hypothetical protein LBB93_01015, partial [Elusimicrobiota bacterium]|nr:hypothetical protein [Elusimicrobiota bacterium]